MRTFEKLKSVRSDFAHYGKRLKGGHHLHFMFVMLRLACMDDEGEIKTAEARILAQIKELGY